MSKNSKRTSMKKWLSDMEKLYGPMELKSPSDEEMQEALLNLDLQQNRMLEPWLGNLRGSSPAGKGSPEQT